MKFEFWKRAKGRVSRAKGRAQSVTRKVVKPKAKKNAQHLDPGFERKARARFGNVKQEAIDYLSEFYNRDKVKTLVAYQIASGKQTFEGITKGALKMLRNPKMKNPDADAKRLLESALEDYFNPRYRAARFTIASDTIRNLSLLDARISQTEAKKLWRDAVNNYKGDKHLEVYGKRNPYKAEVVEIKNVNGAKTWILKSKVNAAYKDAMKAAKATFTSRKAVIYLPRPVSSYSFSASIDAIAKEQLNQKKNCNANIALKTAGLSKQNTEKLFYVYARTKAQFTGNKDWFLVNKTLSRSISSAIKEAKEIYKEQYNAKYLPQLEWKVLDYPITQEERKKNAPVSASKKTYPVYVKPHERKDIDGDWTNISEHRRHARGTAGVGAHGRSKPYKQNPSITKEFKGYETGKVVKMAASDFVRNGKLDQLGQLKSIVIETRNTKYHEDGTVTGGKIYTFNPSKSFVAAESRNQLALVGEGVKHLGGKLRRNSSAQGKVVPVGRIAQITYIVGKSHIENPQNLPRGVRINYFHQFGENSRHEQGVKNPKMPMLFLDHDGMPVIREGGYRITANGIEN